MNSVQELFVLNCVLMGGDKRNSNNTYAESSQNFNSNPRGQCSFLQTEPLSRAFNSNIVRR